MSFAAILGQRPNSSSIDLSNYYTKTESDNKFLPITNGIASSSLEIDEVADSGKRAFTVWSADKTKFVDLGPSSLQWNIVGSGPDDTYVLNIQPFFDQMGGPSRLTFNDKSGGDIILDGIQTTNTANANQAVSVEYMQNNTLYYPNGYIPRTNTLRFSADVNNPANLYYELKYGNNGIVIEQQGTYKGSATDLTLIDNNSKISLDAQNSELTLINRNYSGTVFADSLAPVNVGTPTSSTHAATKEYVDSKAGAALPDPSQFVGPYTIPTNVWASTNNFTFSSGNATLCFPSSGSSGTLYFSFSITCSFSGSSASAAIALSSIFPSYGSWTLLSGGGCFSIFKLSSIDLQIIQNRRDIGFVQGSNTKLFTFDFPQTLSSGTFQLVGNNIPFAFSK